MRVGLDYFELGATQSANSIIFLLEAAPSCCWFSSFYLSSFSTPF